MVDPWTLLFLESPHPLAEAWNHSKDIYIKVPIFNSTHFFLSVLDIAKF